MREAVGDEGEEVATFEEPEGLQEAMPVMVEGPLSTVRAKGEVGTPTGTTSPAGTISFPEGRGGITDL